MRRRRRTSRKLFDPQGFFQHNLTYRQKNGMIIRPKSSNLPSNKTRSIPWTPEEMLQLLLQSGYINRVILHENINNVYTFAEDTYVAAGSTFEPLNTVVPQLLSLNISTRYTFAEDTYVAAGSTFDVQYPSEPTQMVISGDYTFTEYTQFAPQSRIIVIWMDYMPLQYVSHGSLSISDYSFENMMTLIPSFIANDSSYSDYFQSYIAPRNHYYDSLDITVSVSDIIFYFPSNSSNVIHSFNFVYNNTSTNDNKWHVIYYNGGYGKVITSNPDIQNTITFDPLPPSGSIVYLTADDVLDQYLNQTLSITPVWVTNYTPSLGGRIVINFSVIYFNYKGYQ